jgi:hypothetical protein
MDSDGIPAGNGDVPPYVEDRKAREEAIKAAMLGCAICGARVRVPPAGDPFSDGPYRGRYLCADDWTLYYAEHPEHLADRATVEYVKKEAERIKLGRITADAEIVFEEGGSRAFLMNSGTIILRLEKSETLSSDEYDFERFGLLMRALQAVGKAAVPGFEFPPKAL